MLDLYSNASLILTANAYSQSKVFAMKPTGSTSGDFYFSRNSVATRKTSAGTIETVNANIPRLNYPSESLYPGFLLEPSSTNLLVRSNEFSTNPWLTVNIFLTASQAISPDGTLNGWKLDELQDVKPEDSPTIVNNLQTLVTAQGGTIQASSCISSALAGILGITTNVTFNVRQINAFSAIAGKKYICSAYVKPAGRTGVAIQTNINNVYSYIKFNLTGTGSVYETPTGYTASISQEYDGWYRISTSATAVVVGNQYNKYFSIDLLSGSSYTVEYLGSANSGVYLYGAQIEPAQYVTYTTASSYIPTTTAAVIKSSDLMSGSNLSLFVNETDPKIWTLFIDYDAQYNGPSVNGSSFLSLYNSTNNLLWYLSKTSTNIYGYDFLNNTTIFSSDPILNSSKIAITSDGTVMYVYINGNFEASYTPTNNNSLLINKLTVDPTDRGNTSNPLTSVLIKNIIMYPDTLVSTGSIYLTSLNT